MQLVEMAVWGCLGLVFYSYGIYPILLVMVSALAQVRQDISFVLRGQQRRQAELESYPSIAVVISAYNEERCIAERIRNLMELDYPAELVRFYIGSDGSKDKTAEIAGSFRDDRLEFLDFEVNRGKSSVLNDLASRAQADILVFSDANTYFRQDALKKLARHFQNHKVGAVCGELMLVEGATGENLDGIYWKYERILKFNESRLNALLGANGAIYAVRKSCFREIPTDTVVDDFTIAMNVAVDGHIVKYDPEAVAVEEVAPTTGDEFNRRIRIGAGNYQALFRFARVLNPAYGALWWAYLSHKVLRWLGPLLLLGVLAGSVALSVGSVFYALFALLQIVVYVFAYVSRNRTYTSRLLHFLVFWVNMNIALGLGAVRYFRGSVSGSWSSTKR